jgi:hypothetical protein
MALTEQEVHEYIEMMLGFDVIDVETTPAQMDIVVTRTLKAYNKFRPRIRGNQLTLAEGITRYVLDDLSLPYGRGVVDVQPPIGQRTSSEEPDIFSGAFWFYWNLGGRYFQEPADVLARQVDLEDRRLIAGVSRDWDFKFEGDSGALKGVLYIYPPPTGGQVAAYWYAADHLLGDVPQGDQGWIEDYALALVKIILGTVRRKWNQELPMDGATLVQEGKQEKKDLEAEMSKKSGSLWKPRQIA